MSAITIDPNSLSIPDIIAAINDHAALIDAHAGAGVPGWFSLADPDHHFVKNDESAADENSTAMQALWNTVIAAGGGTIYVPVGTWYHAINSASAVVKLTGAPGVPLNARIVIRGEGPGSVLAWGGDADHGDKDFFQFNNGVRNVTFRDLKMIQNRAIVNPDGSEQHHFIDSLTSKWANNENIFVIDCTFGVVKGDCIRGVGGQAVTAAHVAYAGNNVPALFPGPITNPTEPQRVCARYNTSGIIVCVAKADLVDTDFCTVVDGESLEKIYGFDTAGNGVTDERIQVDVSTDTTATEVAARLRTAILANQQQVSVTNTTGTLTLTVEAGSVNVTENVAHPSFTVSNPLYDGGATTVVGTDRNDAPLTEVLPAPTTVAAQTVIGDFEFKTVTSITKAAVGVNPATASIGYDYRIKNTRVLNCVFDGFDFLNADPGYGYRAAVSVQRSTTGLVVFGCYMRGSDDQLIDFEPTSNGDVTACVISGNLLEAHDRNVVTFTLFGNGSRDAIKRSVISHNVLINGRIAGLDLDGVLIQGNRIFLPLTGKAVGILITKLCKDVQILDNEIVADVASAATYAIAVQRNGSGNDAPTRLVVRGNIISTPCANGGGIYVEDPGDDIVLSGNTIRNLSSKAGKGVGVHINIPADTGAKSNHHITGNTCSEAGGGSLHSAFLYTARRADPSNVVIMGNTANGCARGVNVDALTPDTRVWTGYPVISCNALVGCTTPIVLGKGVYAVVGGQQGGVAQYIGAGSPEEAVIAFIGSTFQSSTFQSEDGVAGSSFYVKQATSALNTGWIGK